MANHRSLSFAKGEDWLLSVTVTDGAGNPFTAASAIFEMRDRWTFAPVLSFNAAPQVTVDGSTVTVALSPGSDQSTTATGVLYFWRAWAIDSGGKKSDQVEGEFLVLP